MKLRIPSKLWLSVYAIIGMTLFCGFVFNSVVYHNDPQMSPLLTIVTFGVVLSFLAGFIDSPHLPVREKDKRFILGDDGELIEISDIDEKPKRDQDTH